VPIKPNSVLQYLEVGCGRCELGNTPHCKVHPWSEELTLLREMLRKTDLTEEIKWSAPCYTHRGKNILTLSALKESVVISFFRGAELKDSKNVLEKPGKNSRFARYLRFTNTHRIASLKGVVQAYITEAIQLEESGEKSHASKDTLDEYPDELVQVFSADSDFEKAFLALTPGRQRGYLIYFTSAKKSETKTARVNKCRAKIFSGKGWNER